ncbi:ADP-ribose pyrophosphatase [Marinitoga hydrogenitolerans DSM 16785]|uniref:ADP-ribose pyrophosphatase n=1 Tax=Marinitoga hydrogenitolerans (strain DSM 16785 / JCM 12826 / AT1271) TaxID=1122195 RepID=A0A1M4TE04_MARH1|nr:NUDIX hydrolase [Marinitoga hydrogenitolerans]SHE42673.1 ADP-ribose pyrophosphatase [Marinitoga hydrogenitolerans DSM 16785]
MNFEERELNEEQIFKGVLLDVRKSIVELPNGKKSTREFVVHPGAVAILPVEDDYVYLVEQYRFPIKRHLLEIPAGKFDEIGEEPLECGKRELEEEIGKKAKTWIYLGYIHTTPGFSNELIHLYLVKDFEESEMNLDEDEFLEVKKINIKEFEKMILNNEITDAKTIAAYTRAKLIGGI